MDPRCPARTISVLKTSKYHEWKDSKYSCMLSHASCIALLEEIVKRDEWRNHLIGEEIMVKERRKGWKGIKKTS